MTAFAAHLAAADAGPGSRAFAIPPVLEQLGCKSLKNDELGRYPCQRFEPFRYNVRSGTG
jgi:hypothetical protein